MTCRVPDGYILRQVAGDGACMFRALVQAEADTQGLELSKKDEEMQARYLRQRVVDFIRRNKKQYDETWKYVVYNINDFNAELSHNVYVQMMSKHATEGTEIELRVAAKLLRRRICVHSTTPSNRRRSNRKNTPGSMIEPIDGTVVDARRSILHLHLRHRHYTPFVSPTTSRRTRRNKTPTKTAKVNDPVRKKMIREIMNRLAARVAPGQNIADIFERLVM